MSRLFILVAVMGAVVAFSAGAALAQAETETQTVRVPVDFDLDNSCTGESVTGTGTLIFVSHLTEDAQGGTHVAGQMSLIASGVGSASGTEYRVVRVQPTAFNLTGASESTYILKTRYVSTDGTDNFYQDITVHLTVDHEGTLTAEVVNISSGECRG
jgi:hypothetical protein